MTVTMTLQQVRNKLRILAEMCGDAAGLGYNQYADAIDAHLARDGAKVPDGWQPIETAPKDGTRVVLTIQWDDDPVIASFIRGGWHADTSFLSVHGDASLHSEVNDKYVIGWASIPEPLWRSSAAPSHKETGE